MANKIRVPAMTKITDGIFKGYVGFCYGADFTDKNSKWHYVLIQVDEITTIQIHPKYVDQDNISNDDPQINIASLLQPTNTGEDTTAGAIRQSMEEGK